MFKIENYITPILLSYVDKYIRNFRTEDSQVSLWGGDATFHNLDLRLEVLEQELHLPFSFVSGHIHELLIHVPWTKLASEPITITINTIECILKLKSADTSVNTDSDNTVKEKPKRLANKRQVVEAPPGYVQTLINKIVSNIKINCNNLILKYVEEDIVVSMNVKLLTFESANQKWEPSYIDISSNQVILRKLLLVSDLTICLDKRNASGKIDFYQEPVLYRCSLSVRIFRQYYPASAQRSSTTRVDVYCSSMEFCMTEQQVPMLLRIIRLLLALQQKELKPESRSAAEDLTASTDITEIIESAESWAGWAWSFVPSILPTSWDQDWNKEQEVSTSGHTMHIGFYIDYVSLTFKVCELNSERGGYYAQRKLKYIPLLTLRLQGFFFESVALGVKWFHCSSGISQAVLFPMGQCSCAHNELNESVTTEYLKAGIISMAHKMDSLFDSEAVENKGQQRVYNSSWDYHVDTVTESSLLERTPAFASDYIYQVEVPDDTTSERMSEFGSDLEYSNFYEKSLLRIVVGPLRTRLCSGLFHRLNSLRVAASSYDYQPYSPPSSDVALNELREACAEDFEALMENVPRRVLQFTVLAPIIELELADHPYFEATKGNLYRKRKKISTSGISGTTLPPNKKLPKITLECQCIDAKLHFPMYVKRLVHTACKLPEVPLPLFEACHNIKSVNVIGLCCRLILSSKKQTTIVAPSNASYLCKTILKPHYWPDSDLPHQEITFESEIVTVTGTKPKFMVIAHILEGLIKMDGQTSIGTIMSNSLMHDAARNYGLPYLEICVEGLRFKKVITNSTLIINTSLDSVKAFIYDPMELNPYMRESESGYSVASPTSFFSQRGSNTAFLTKEIQQVLFISGPESKDEKSAKNADIGPLFMATIQLPLNPQVLLHPPIVTCKFQKLKISVDPLLCRWLMYKPRMAKKKSEFFDPQQNKNRNFSEASGSLLETSRKIGTPHESVHSSSDREHGFIPPPIQRLIKQAETNNVRDSIHNFLNKWFFVGKNMFLNCKVEEFTIYFPTVSLSAVGSQGIRQAVEEALKKDNFEVFVISLPSTAIYSASQHSNLKENMKDVPIKLPSNIWPISKTCFPWIIDINDIWCYALQNKHVFNITKPFSVHISIGVSAKSGTYGIKQTASDPTTSSMKELLNTSLSHSRNSETSVQIDVNSSKYDSDDLELLGVCIHIFTPFVEIAFSEDQMCLIASILYGLSEVLASLLPEQKSEPPKIPEVATQNVMGWSSTISPTLLRESSIDSSSEKTPPIGDLTGNMDPDGVKLSLWLQWSISRFCIKLYSHNHRDYVTKKESSSQKPNLKLVLDVEEFVNSYDLQSVYLKITFKVASINIRHFKRKSGGSKEWKAGQFLGVVMRLKEDELPRERKKEDNSFVKVTITIASCKHTHALWGTVQKHKVRDAKIPQSPALISSSRYITEIVVTTQPIDFIFPLSVLKSFYMIFEPLMDLSVADSQEVVQNADWLLQINNHTLPLVYIECQSIRVTIPSGEVNTIDVEHDVCVFQIETIKLTPTAINPICRSPCRPDIYQLAAQSRILNIPGSEVEDRQYQLDISGLRIHTSTWENMDSILNMKTLNFSTLRTMSENPALEWNNLDQEKANKSNHLNFLPVIKKFDLSVIVAPAMVYKGSTLVCGHSVEINCVTDININVSLGQIKLASALFSEAFNLFKPFLMDNVVVKRPKITIPYPKFDMGEFEAEEFEEEICEINRDSGIDTSEFLSILSVKTSKSSATQTDLGKRGTISNDSEKSHSIFPRPPNPLPAAYHNVPVDLLITGSKIIVTLYQIDQFSGRTKSKHRDLKQQQLMKYAEEEKGYDASEEGSIDEKHVINAQAQYFQPLLYVLISQPNAFLSRFYLGRKIQLSCFDVGIKISGTEYIPRKCIPLESDFPINLLKTKSGMPNPDTGIFPAFFTLKWSRGLGKPAAVEIEIARPTKILCSVSRWNYLINVQTKVMESVMSSSFHSNLLSQSAKVNVKQSANVRVSSKLASHKITENYTKFKEIKHKLLSISSLNVQLAQVVLVFKTDHFPELNLSISKLSNCLTISNRPERLINLISLENLTVGVLKDQMINLLLNPWSVSMEVVLFWEPWQSVDSDPQIHIAVDSDCIMLDVSPEHIRCVEGVLNDIKEFFNNLPFDGSSSESSYTLGVSSIDKEQYYKDDLRAGAFQFLDATSNNIDELPLPYQVIFWNKPKAAMAWRYPQPRTLTKVRVFPVPFRITSDSDDDYQILCHLEYWSECHGYYHPYLQFYLSENEVRHLELPENYAQSVACVWRVVLSIQNSNNKFVEQDRSKVLISSRALAACIRIDSYFNKTLVPDLTLSLEISAINVSLYNTFNKSTSIVMPPSLKGYTCDMLIPENHCFLTLILDDTKAFLSTWNFESAIFDIGTVVKCSILDYTFLTQQILLEPFHIQVGLNFTQSVLLSVMSNPINIKFSPSIAHTLAVSLQMWEQNWNNENQPDKLVVMTRYVLCNNTNVNLRFGQTSTEEDVLLLPRFCHLYSWRSQKSKQTMRLGIEEHDWVWSRPFQIDSEGTEMCEIALKNKLCIFVTVKKVSSTQKQILFSGQLMLCNMLLEHFEFKVVPIVNNDKDKEFKKAPNFLISGRSSPPSLLINTSKKYHLRIRFYGLESAWSGDIPLTENSKCTQPWLVKVPLQERGQFLSIWCRIVTERFSDNDQILAVFWPLFMVRSNLPVSAKVHIETPTLNVHIESDVRGKGEFQQLYCPGTIDHSHQLSFEIDGGFPTSNPYVPLNYSLVDQKQFFKKSENESISETLEVLNMFDETSWPYFEDMENIEWISDEQPLTHVQVRYQNACPNSSSLLVELLPWSLLVNVLSCPIAIIVNEKELCRVAHRGIVTTPKLEETFHVGVGINGTWNVSLPLQLGKSEWSQTFIMPKITGTIPLEGNINTPVLCHKHICMVSIISSVVNEIRLLKVCSSHVLTNFTSIEMNVVCLAITDLEQPVKMPNNLHKFAFTIGPSLDKKNAGVSILQWYLLDKETDLNANFALYVCFSLSVNDKWSCPVRVDDVMPRRSISVQSKEQNIPLVITAQSYKGQIYLSIHDDPRPQTLIENMSGTKLFVAQFYGEEYNAIMPDCQHLKWVCQVDDFSSVYYTMPGYSEKFPHVSQASYVENLVLAVDIRGASHEYKWSLPICITNNGDHFVRVPSFGDLKIKIIVSVYTINITIESTNHIEINARDVRGRLIIHETIGSVRSCPLPGEGDNVSTSVNTSSTSTVNSTYLSAVDIPSTGTESGVVLRRETVGFETPHSSKLYGFQQLPTLMEQSNVNLMKSLSLRKTVSEPSRKLSDLHIPETLTRNSATQSNFLNYKVDVCIKAVTLAFVSDLNSVSQECTEIANLSFNKVVVSVKQNSIMEVVFAVSEIQLDNQMYTQGMFDFPVVLIRQEVQSESNENLSLNSSISQWISNALENPVLRVDLDFETWNRLGTAFKGIKNVKLNVQPISFYIEDVFIAILGEYFSMLSPGNLVLWSKRTKNVNDNLNSIYVGIPNFVLWEASGLAQPLVWQNLTIEPISVLISFQGTFKLYIAVDQSPLYFSKFEVRRILTTPYKLGHTIITHYFSGALYAAGWVLSSAELFGTPCGLARAMGTGLYDFVNLPYQGLVQGPWAFLIGITHGSASLMKHMTSGTLHSVTKFASSVARNFDRLTLDEEHLRRTEEQRRQVPQGLAQGFVQGLTGLGISLLGAVGGIAHHPIKSVMEDGASPRGLAAGVGLGLMGVITKPISGAADLVALTGQGLLRGAGWSVSLNPKRKPIVYHMYSNQNSIIKYNWKFVEAYTKSSLLFMTNATWFIKEGHYEGVALVLTTEALIIVNTTHDISQRVISLSELSGVDNRNDPTLLTLKLSPPHTIIPKDEDECAVEMDPACRARVADYVRATVGILRIPDISPENSELAISTCPSPTIRNELYNEQTLTFYVNPESRNYFLNILSLANQKHQNYSFPVF